MLSGAGHAVFKAFFFVFIAHTYLKKKKKKKHI